MLTLEALTLGEMSSAVRPDRIASAVREAY